MPNATKISRKIPIRVFTFVGRWAIITCMRNNYRFNPTRSNGCKIAATHCENCGSTDNEDLDVFDNDGYTLCCNELVAYGAASCRNHHAN